MCNKGSRERWSEVRPRAQQRPEGKHLIDPHVSDEMKRIKKKEDLTFIPSSNIPSVGSIVRFVLEVWTKPSSILTLYPATDCERKAALFGNGGETNWVQSSECSPWTSNIPLYREPPTPYDTDFRPEWKRCTSSQNRTSSTVDAHISRLNTRRCFREICK